MATRTVTGTLYNAAGVPMSGERISFTMDRDTYVLDPDVSYVASSVSARTDVNGEFSVELEAGLPVLWNVHLPGQNFVIAVPTGLATTLEELRSIYNGTVPERVPGDPPTVTDFTNMQHPHTSAATGGTLNVPTAFNIKKYGAAVDGTTNDATAITAAITAASDAGGGIVWIDGHAKWSTDSPLEIPSNVSLRGIPGKSTLDFSGRSTYANGSEGQGALIEVAGELSGSAIALAEDARRYPDIQLRASGINRSGTTATVTTSINHGLSTGDYVFVDGGSSSLAHPPEDLVTGSYLGNPQGPITVTGSTTFTYAVPNSGDTSLGVTRIYPAGRIIVCDDTTPFANDDMVIISSEAVRSNDGGESVMVGEINFIERVLDGNALLLRKPVEDTYAVSDSATIQNVSPARNVSIKGLTIIGKGHNPGVAVGDRGIRVLYGRDVSVRGCTFRDTDQVAITFWACTHWTAEHNTITFDPDDVVGLSTGDPDIQYGIAFYNGSSDGTIKRNQIHRGRHAVVQGNSASLPGICRNINIEDNNIFGTWFTAISTHQGNEKLRIHHNTIIGGYGGVSLRYGLDCDISHNHIEQTEVDAIEVYRHIERTRIEHNQISQVRNAIFIEDALSTGDVVGDLAIRGNRILGCERGVYVNLPTSGSFATGIDITDNRITDCANEAILIQVGASGQVADGFEGIIADNDIRDIGGVASSSAIWLVNPRGVPIHGNRIASASGMARGIRIQGSGAQECVEYGNVISGATTANVSIEAGSGHRSEQATAESLVIASGVVTPTMRSLTGMVRLVRVDTESAAATDDLDTITSTGIPDGTILVLTPTSSSRDVTIRHNGGGGGNIRLNGATNFTFSNAADTLALMWHSTLWKEIGRGDNG